MKKYLPLAIKNLSRNKGRSVLAILALGAATSLLLQVLMLSAGIDKGLKSFFIGPGIDMRVAPKGSIPFTSNATVNQGHKITSKLLQNKNIKKICPMYGNYVFLKKGKQSPRPAVATGVIFIPEQEGWDIYEGRNLRLSDNHYNGGKYNGPWSHEVVINDNLAKELNIKVGDTLTVSNDLAFSRNSQKLRSKVVGLATSRFTYPDERVAWFYISELQDLHGVTKSDPVSDFVVTVRDKSKTNETHDWIEKTFKELSAFRAQDLATHFQNQLRVFNQFSQIVAIVGALLSFVLIYTIITIAVNERIGEIVTLRAIGISKATIDKTVIGESLTLTLVGAALGIPFGIAMSRVLNAMLKKQSGVPATFQFFIYEPKPIIVSLTTMMVVGLLAALIPSRRAAKLNIVDSLRERIL